MATCNERNAAVVCAAWIRTVVCVQNISHQYLVDLVLKYYKTRDWQMDGAVSCASDGTDQLDDLLMKLLVLGDVGAFPACHYLVSTILYQTASQNKIEVGKTCLLLRFTENTFTSSRISIIDRALRMRTVGIDGKRIKMQIWDFNSRQRGLVFH